jgi:hypothetical protein
MIDRMRMRVLSPQTSLVRRPVQYAKEGPPDLVLRGLLRDIRIEDQQHQRRGQFRLAVRHLLARMVTPMVINMPDAGGTPPKTICNKTHPASAKSSVTILCGLCDLRTPRRCRQSLLRCARYVEGLDA